MSRPEPEKKLVECFEGVLDCLKTDLFWKYFGSNFSERYPDIDESFKGKIKDLQDIDCPIVVIGETSAGKSTLINKIIGENLLFEDLLEATTKIYRLKHSDTYQIKTYKRYVATPTVQKFKNSKELRNKLEDLENESKRNPSLHQVDVMIPFARLQGNITIVDTPGIGDSEDLKKLLHEYIPKAVAFVFVVDVSRAGGLQTDRLVQMLCHITSSRNAFDKLQCFDPCDVLFLRNKWDCVDASKERKESIKLKLSTKIKKLWVCAKDENIFDVTLKKANSAEMRSYIKEYERFETAVHALLVKNKNKRIIFHSKYLGDVIRFAMDKISTATTHALSDKESNEKKWKLISEEINVLEKRITEMQLEEDSTIDEILQNLASSLHRYIHSMEFKNKVLEEKKTVLSSVMKINIDREIGKRIKKATEEWIAKYCPEIAEEEVKRLILKKAEEVGEELQRITKKLGGISQSFSAKSASVDGVMWTLITGTACVFSKVFWRFLAGPQVATVITGLTFLSYVSAGFFYLLAILDDRDEIIQKSFGLRMESLSRDDVLGIMKEKYERHLRDTYKHIFKKLLPAEVQNLYQTMNDVRKNVEQFRMRYAELKSLGKKFETYLHELEAMDHQEKDSDEESHSSVIETLWGVVDLFLSAFEWGIM